MVECGSMSQPPSFSNITVWGIVTFIIMLVVGIDSIYGVMSAIHFNDFLFSILLLVGSGFGVAGLIIAILAIVQSNGTLMKLAAFCFLISCLVHIVLLIFSIFGSGLYLGAILQIILDVFLCYLFYLQNSGFSPSA